MTKAQSAAESDILSLPGAPLSSMDQTGWSAWTGLRSGLQESTFEHRIKAVVGQMQTAISQSSRGGNKYTTHGQASSWTVSRRNLYTRVTAPRRTHLPLKRAILSAQSDILLKLELTPLLYICLDELSREDTGPPGSHWAWFWTDLLFVSTLPNIASGHKIQGELWAVYASLRCFDRTHLWGW